MSGVSTGFPASGLGMPLGNRTESARNLSIPFILASACCTVCPVSSSSIHPASFPTFIISSRPLGASLASVISDIALRTFSAVLFERARACTGDGLRRRRRSATVKRGGVSCSCSRGRFDEHVVAEISDIGVRMTLSLRTLRGVICSTGLVLAVKASAGSGVVTRWNR